MDSKVRKDFETARDLIPDRVASETPMLSFLRTDDYDPVKAARRLASYWTCRRSLFGPERWLLPMDQTGHGALDEWDIQAVRSGTYLCYPVTTQQGEEDLLLLMDITRSFDLSERAAQCGQDLFNIFGRVDMYMATALNSRIAQRKGALYIHVVRAAPRPAIDLRNGFEMVRTSLPVKIRRLVVAQVYEPNKEAILDFSRFQMVKVFEYKMQSTLAKDHDFKGVELVHAESMSKTADRIEQALQIQRNCMPTILGGCACWDTKLATWNRAQTAIEMMLHLNRTVPSPLPFASLSPAAAAAAASSSSTLASVWSSLPRVVATGKQKRILENADTTMADVDTTTGAKSCTAGDYCSLVPYKTHVLQPSHGHPRQSPLAKAACVERQPCMQQERILQSQSVNPTMVRLPVASDSIHVPFPLTASPTGASSSIPPVLPPAKKSRVDANNSIAQMNAGNQSTKRKAKKKTDEYEAQRDDETLEEFLRRRNAFYQRRRNQRACKLKEDVEQLQNYNLRLRREQARLEDLLQAAQSLIFM